MSSTASHADAAADPALIVHDPQSLAASLGAFAIRDDTSPEEAMAAMHQLGSFNGAALGMVSFAGCTPWEVHADDEFLLVVRGEVEVTLLPHSGDARQVRMRPGQVLVIPSRHWHRQDAPDGAIVLFITGPEGGVSFASDPRAALAPEGHR